MCPPSLKYNGIRCFVFGSISLKDAKILNRAERNSRFGDLLWVCHCEFYSIIHKFPLTYGAVFPSTVDHVGVSGSI